MKDPSTELLTLTMTRQDWVSLHALAYVSALKRGDDEHIQFVEEFGQKVREAGVYSSSHREIKTSLTTEGELNG